MNWQDTKRTFERLQWPILVFLFGWLYILVLGSELAKQQFGILAWKSVLLGIATAFAHVIRVTLFDYVDISEALKEKTVAGSLQLVSMVILYAAIIHAICGGL